jgi:Leucine-rich repeat (LRR) protein
LKGLPLESLMCDLRLFHQADEELLRALPLTLLSTPGKSTPVDEYWKQIAARREAALAFADSAKDLAPDKQADAVRARLRELNPDVPVALSYVADSGAVTVATLDCVVGPTIDVTPLMGFPALKKLTLTNAFPWLDLSSLKFLPLEELTCEVALARKNAPVLKEIATLHSINGQPADEFWKRLETSSGSQPSAGGERPGVLAQWQPTAEQQAFFDAVALVDADQQAVAVERKLKQINPGWSGKLEHRIQDNIVTHAKLEGPELRDLWPLGALPGLVETDCSGTSVENIAWVERLTELTSLTCSQTPLRDLGPVAHLTMLEQLNCSDTGVSDLSPLAGLPLRELRCFFVTAYNENAVEALKTLPQLETINGLTLAQLENRRAEVELLRRTQGVFSPEDQLARVVEKLREFNPGFDGKVLSHAIESEKVVQVSFHNCPINDLSPLRALPDLKQLNCAETQVSDLSPLTGMPLTELSCFGTQVSELSPLVGMPLTSLECGYTQVSDLSPLVEMKLTFLTCNQTSVSDLSPLAGMPLTYLICRESNVSDLSPLAGMRLTTLDCDQTQVADLSPVAGMKLTHLRCGGTRVSDLSPLKGMPLTTLDCNQTQVADLSPLAKMPLEELTCPEPLARTNAPMLKEIATLKTINGRPAEEFWKE